MQEPLQEPKKPTPSELAILRVLWSHGPSTVREIQDRLEDDTTGYTTVLKLVQIMKGKGLVERDESQRAHIYRALDDGQKIQRQLVSDLMDRAFGGSAAKLVLNALSTKPASREERDEIRDLLAQFEEVDGNGR